MGHPKVRNSVNKKHLPGLLLVTATAVMAAHSQTWASAIATAAAVYSAITAHQDRGDRL